MLMSRSRDEVVTLARALAMPEGMMPEGILRRDGIAFPTVCVVLAIRGFKSLMLGPLLRRPDLRDDG